MATTLLPDDLSSLIISFDVTMSENHEATADVTEHPVELGSDISDNVKQNPASLTVEVYMTSTPIVEGGTAGGVILPQLLEFPTYSPPLAPTPGALFNAIGNGLTAVSQAIFGPPPPIVVNLLQFPNQFDPVQATYNTLMDLWTRGQTMSVVTSVTTFNTMVLTNVSLPRTEPGGASFTLNFKQIRTVTTATVTAPKPAVKRGNPNQAKGGQSTSTPDANSGAKASFAKQLATKLLGG